MHGGLECGDFSQNIELQKILVAIKIINMKNRKKVQITFFKEKNKLEKIKSIDINSLKLFAEMMRDRYRG